ncbi:hypothetical protein HOD08_01925 [bacterium]|nr:hypothetical protein [bacterium]
MISIRSISLVCFLALPCNIFSTPQPKRPPAIKVPVATETFRNWFDRCVVSPGKCFKRDQKTSRDNIYTVLGREKGKLFCDRLTRYCNIVGGVRSQDIFPAIESGEMDEKLNDGYNSKKLLEGFVAIEVRSPCSSSVVDHRMLRTSAAAKQGLPPSPNSFGDVITPDELVELYESTKAIGEPTLMDFLKTGATRSGVMKVLKTLSRRNWNVGDDRRIDWCGIDPGGNFADSVLDAYHESRCTCFSSFINEFIKGIESMSKKNKRKK